MNSKCAGLAALGALAFVTAAYAQSPAPNIPSNTWVVVRPVYAGQPNGGQIWPSGWGNKGAYDPVTQRVIISERWYDTIHGVSIFANGLHAYDPASNVFTILKLNNWYAKPTSSGGYMTTALPSNTTDPTPPDHHPLMSVEVVPGQNAVYTVNGVNTISLPDPSILDKTWRFDLGTKSWTLVSARETDPNYPPNNEGSPSGEYYDPVTGKLVYFVLTNCGCTGTATYLFNLSTNLWTAVPQDPSSLNVYVAGAGFAYDTKRNVSLAYGGNNNITQSPTAHLWSYSVAPNKWTQLRDAPVAAMAPGFAYDSKHDIFLALVGNNTYIYYPATNAWAQFPATLTRPPAAPSNWQSITYDPAHDVFVFEGGNWQSPLMAVLRYDPSTIPPPTPPTVSISSPAAGAILTGTVQTVATASANLGMASVQFQVDGANLGLPIMGTGPSYSTSWDTTSAANGPHVLSAVASDTAGNTATTSISIMVSNPVTPPVISAVSATAITSSSATISWKTDKASDSQVAYDLSTAYGLTTPLAPALVTAHTVNLSGLTPGNTYYYEVRSRDAQGNLSTAAGFTFTTLQPLLFLHANPSEVSGLSGGSTVTPTTAPPGFRGSVVVNNGGSVNFVSAVAGDGVYFLNCCGNTSNAYYKFTGATVGNIFNLNQGQISFSLKSRYSFAQRQSTAPSQRFAFDVRDNNPNNHLFYFRTQISSGLQFAYSAGGATQFYWAPAGTEDALFGNGVVMNVLITWDGSISKLYLNGALVQSASYTKSAANWTASSVFDLGAYEYGSFGGYNVSDDVIAGFSVIAPAIVPDTIPPVVSMTSPSNGATLAGLATLTANATDNTGVAGVQFQLDGANLGTAVTGLGPSYSMSWDTTTATNGTHTLTATATDPAGNTSANSVSVTVNNPLVAPAISNVSGIATSPSSATITWTTDKPSNTQVAYGLTTSYSLASPLAPAFVTAHSVILTGLTAGTTYHFQVLSRSAQGILGSSADFIVVTPTPPQTVFLLHANASEVSGATNGSIVTPTTAPPGFTGTAVVNGSGTINFAPAQVGNGVYFLNCCGNTNNAYYKFTGATVGSLFNVNGGQVTFYLKSRYSFAQRQANAPSQRYAFDVRDDNVNNHLFYFRTQISGGLQFAYTVGGATQFYWAPPGTEDALFGSGVVLKVTINWDGSVGKLYFNDLLVQSAAYTKPVPNWTANSNFDLGAYEYGAFGGYNVLDDVIDEFTIAQ